MDKTALIIGANGGFGRAVAQALVAQGWVVTGLARTRPAADGPYAHFVQGDARSSADVASAATGQALIVHAVNPPYDQWAKDALPALAASIAAAKAVGATLLFPGNIYNFGPDAGADLFEDKPQNPVTKKGKIRAEMEAMLRQAGNNGQRIIVLRCGDFFGPTQKSTWFEAALLGGKKTLPTKLSYPGDPALGHSWAYLPDVGEAAVRLVESPLGHGFHAFGFPGHFVSGDQLAGAVRNATGKPLPIKPFPWALLRIVALFNPMVRELFEMRYLWQVAHRIDGTALADTIGPLTATPLQTAVSATLAAR